MHDRFFPTQNHTWHVFAFKASFQHINKKNYVSSSDLISINTPPPSLNKNAQPERKLTTKNQHTLIKKLAGKIPTPGPTISLFFRPPPPIGPRCQTSPRSPPADRPYPPFKLRVDPARSAPHRLVDGKFLAMTCAFSAAKDSGGEERLGK